MQTIYILERASFVIEFRSSNLLKKRSRQLWSGSKGTSSSIIKTKKKSQGAVTESFKPNVHFAKTMYAKIIVFTCLGTLGSREKITPTHIFSCPVMAAALQKIDMDPEQLYAPKMEDIATAVIEMHGDI
ncbi:hypothetical protein LAZ67_3005784 [Cordylochernes scorpioides]|uniref:Uncharacterized protein n=1 Tax=Cordylochernes scorpioides TaxID=51811 RepID=A0ABY6KAM2_9ARAC|nr:hypothetical protein LAZ67_3005784 [Cordylochernes scorpioides]